MNCRILLALLVISLPVTRLDATPKKAAQVVRRTVLDYFRLLPLDAGIFEAGERESLIGKDSPHLIDNRNDYMQATGDGAQPSFQIAVFRYRSRDLVAVSSDSRVGDYGFDLWRYQSGKWQNVSKALSPVADNSELHFVLPRNGTTIRVFANDGQLHNRLLWRNGHFEVEKQRVIPRPYAFLLLSRPS